jgi:hypothetical protein
MHRLKRNRFIPKKIWRTTSSIKMSPNATNPNEHFVIYSQKRIYTLIKHESIYDKNHLETTPISLTKIINNNHQYHFYIEKTR